MKLIDVYCDEVTCWSILPSQSKQRGTTSFHVDTTKALKREKKSCTFHLQVLDRKFVQHIICIVADICKFLLVL
ncbi:hypothetical protein RchiOBHm_Chr7g0206341 [Rosa chinensis]|uniref:Uncharacterized protein n=1 Tax=Rosa chinensis TaxID=74649 RepID=A0A2P6P987_ROSCH|nr:hypothetical protein RchiOBHm_Chr7g0206341 [Rosa chinensis]